jgi:hypothetical protein
MQAMNGSAVRSRTRLVGCTMAIVLALSALVLVSTASAEKTPTKETYLALGDSLAFGYSTQLFNENITKGVPPSAFLHGYADYYLKHLKPNVTGTQLTNNGCPGESTGSMIGTGPLGAQLSAFAGAENLEAPCAYHNVNGLSLHHEYGTGKSQLENALETIAVDAGAGKPVTTLTLDIGANDQLHQIKKCEEAAGPTAKAAGEKAFIETLTKGGTKAEAEAAGKKAGEEAGKAYVKKCLEENFKTLVASILKNIGASLFAIREGDKFGGVKYLGTIVVQGGYDPYGRVFGPEELLEGSNPLAAIINQEEAKTVAKFGACYANPQPIFNPGSFIVKFNPHEPQRLQKWTNMANFTESNGKKNGPDIHPTRSGYAQLSAIMVKDCP